MWKINPILCVILAQVIKSDKIHETLASNFTNLAERFIADERNIWRAELNKNRKIDGVEIVGYAKQIGPNWCVITKDNTIFVAEGLAQLANSKIDGNYLIIHKSILKSQKPFLHLGDGKSPFDISEVNSLFMSQILTILNWDELLDDEDRQFVHTNCDQCAEVIDKLFSDSKKLDSLSQEMCKFLAVFKTNSKLQRWEIGKLATAKATLYQSNSHISGMHITQYPTTNTQTESYLSTKQLMTAAKTGDLKNIELLIQDGVNIDVVDEGFRCTALAYAAHSGHVDIANTLISRGADVNMGDGFGRTPLIHAARHKHVNVAEALIVAGTHVNTIDGFNKTAIVYASENGCVDLVNLLIKSGSAINMRQTIIANISRNDVAELQLTALMAAAQNRKIDIINILIANGAQVNEKNSSGCTALIYAVANGYADIVELLVQKGATLDQEDNEAKTALIHAINTKDVSIGLVKALLEKGADFDCCDQDERTPLMYASKNGLVEIANILIESGAEIDAKDSHDKTALMYAIESNNEALVKTFIEKGADVNNVDTSGYTTLIYAVKVGNVKILDMLLQSKITVDVIDEAIINIRGSELTALMYASLEGHADIVNSLIKSGADVNMNLDGAMALMYASLEGHANIVESLITSGADVNIGSDSTPLIVAAESGHQQIVEILIDKDPEIDATNEEGKTALINALDKGYIDIVKILIKCGANLDKKDEDGKTALIHAVELASYYCSQEAKSNVESDISCNKYVEAIDLLIANGAKLDEEDNSGKTALDYVKECEDVNSAKILTSKLANISKINENTESEAENFSTPKNSNEEKKLNALSRREIVASP
ncbi:MAG: ankyrin repeat domain-containing protein [Alphaproteobacteria bacterium]|nr:MAG: ankyrin repeat domain-containing protein [Alphaproteobacteria bacterium]